MEFIPLKIKNIPLVFSFLGMFFAIFWNNLWFIAVNKKDIRHKDYRYFNFEVFYPQSLVNFIWFLQNSWYFNYVYNYYIGYSILKGSYEYFYKLIDKGFIEILGVRGISLICYESSLVIRRESLGYIYHLNCFLVINFIVMMSLILII